MFVSTLLIPNIESLSQSNILSPGGGSFGRNRADMNIQQRTTSKVANTEIVMEDNKELDTLRSQDILNVFAAAELPYHSSSDSAEYKRAWPKAKVIRSSILSAGECLTHVVEHYPLYLIRKNVFPLWLATSAIFPKQYSNAIN